jgi:hypothetical protein
MLKLLTDTGVDPAVKVPPSTRTIDGTWANKIEEHRVDNTSAVARFIGILALLGRI